MSWPCSTWETRASTLPTRDGGTGRSEPRHFALIVDGLRAGCQARDAITRELIEAIARRKAAETSKPAADRHLAPSRALQEMDAWRTPAMTRRYAHLCAADLATHAAHLPELALPGCKSDPTLRIFQDGDTPMGIAGSTTNGAPARRTAVHVLDADRLSRWPPTHAAVHAPEQEKRRVVTHDRNDDGPWFEARVAELSGVPATRAWPLRGQPDDRENSSRDKSPGKVSASA